MYKWLMVLCVSWSWAQVDFDQHLNISKEEYRARRDTLRATLDHPLILMAAPQRNRINDTDHEFRQENQFYYLTGYNEPDAMLILSKEPFNFEGQMVHELIFVQESSPSFETWIGKRLGVKGTMEQLGIEKATALRGEGDFRKPGPNLFEGFMKTFAVDHPKLYLTTPIIQFQEFGNNEPSYYESYKQKLTHELSAAVLDPATQEGRQFEILDHKPVLDQLRKMRAVKSEAEVAMVQRAVDITLSGHRESLRLAKGVPFEYQVEAAVEFAFRYNGAEALGYNSIVGCGANGTILHYMDNNGPMRANEMLVLDAGAEYRNYASDITRSFPANGKFSKEQAAIYQIVRDAQDAGATQFIPGSNRAKVESAVVKTLSAGLVKLGIIKFPAVEKKVSELLEPEQGGHYLLAEELSIEGETLYPYTRLSEPALKLLAQDRVVKLYDANEFRQVCPHGWGHSVGLDVHDPAGMEFETNMIFTIEPGIYISDRVDFKIDPAYLNIGCRIEDMYLVTATGNLWMSQALPREIPELEKLMAEKSTLMMERHSH